MNVLWIMTDQHRADCLGFMGNRHVQTPKLDRLAETGVIFDNSFCQSPVCMASRAVLFTGRYPEAVRVRGMGILPPSETTFPEVLQRHGFETAAFGKVHLTPELYTRNQLHRDTPILDWRPFARDGMLPPFPSDDPCKHHYGFQTHIGCEDILQGRFIAWLRETAPEFLEQTTVPVSPDGPSDLVCSPYPSDYHPSSFIGQSAADFIASRDRNRPWFAFCSFIAPHHPFEAPVDQIDRYDPGSIALPDPTIDVDPTCIPYPARDAIGEMARYPAHIQRTIIQHYYAAISLIDDNVGRLIETLERTGQMDDTLIVFVADHGEFLGGHGLLRKPSLHYDETLRVPLLIRMPPGRLCPRREPGLVELTDVFPSLLGLLGIPSPPGVQGTDWSTALREQTEIGRDDIYADMFGLMPQRFGECQGPYMAVRTIRTNDWKLNVYPDAGRQYGQLFNLKDDPNEQKNRYADKDYATIRNDMLWRLLQRVHRNTDPMPPYLTQY